MNEFERADIEKMQWEFEQRTAKYEARIAKLEEQVTNGGHSMVSVLTGRLADAENWKDVYRVNAAAAQDEANRTNAKIDKLKRQIRELFMNTVPCDALSPDNIAKIFKLLDE
jgi:outer membrane murein-binding lipoprotein Lpp